MIYWSVGPPAHFSCSGSSARLHRPSCQDVTAEFTSQSGFFLIPGATCQSAQSRDLQMTGRSGDFCCLAGGRLLPRRDEGYQLGSAETTGHLSHPSNRERLLPVYSTKFEDVGRDVSSSRLCWRKNVPSNASQFPAELTRASKRRSRPGGGSSL